MANVKYVTKQFAAITLHFLLDSIFKLNINLIILK